MKAIRTVVAGLLIGCLLAFAQTREVYNIGVTANDGTGDTLRGAFIKAGINESNLFKVLFTNATFTVGRDWTFDLDNTYDFDILDGDTITIDAKTNNLIGVRQMNISSSGLLYLSGYSNLSILTPTMNTWNPADAVLTNRVLTLVDPTNGYWEAVSLNELVGDSTVTASKLTKWDSSKRLVSSDVSIGDVVSEVASVADMIALDATERTVVQTLGYYAAGDGGDARYRWASGYSGTTNSNGGALAVSGGAWVQIDEDVNVRQFGAVGDGATDDETAIDEAVRWASANKKILRIPEGTYIVGGTVDLRDNTTIIGDGPGSVIKADDGISSTVMMNIDSQGNDNIRLERFAIDGNRSTRTGTNAPNLRIEADLGYMATNIVVRSMYFRESPYHTAQFFNVANATVANNVVDGGDRDGFTFWRNSTNLIITDNIILNVGDDGIGLNSESGGTEAGRLIQGVVVNGNRITQSSASVLGTGIRVSGVRNASIGNNIISGTYSWGILVEGGDASGGGDGTTPMEVLTVVTTEGETGTATEVVEVTLTNSVTNAKWVLVYAGQETDPIDYNASAATVQATLEALPNIGSGNMTVSGSAGGPYTLTFAGSLALTAVYDITGYVWSTSREVIVHSNQIRDTGSSGSSGGGINMSAYVRRIRAVGNQVYNPYQHGFSIAASDVLLDGNIVFGGQASGSMGFNLTGQRITMTGNRVNGVPSTGVNITGGNCTITGNTIVDAGTSSPAAAIQVNADGNTVTGNFLRNTRQVGYGIRVINTAQFNAIAGNMARDYGRTIAVVDDSTGYNFLGANTQQRTVTASLTNVAGTITIRKQEANAVNNYLDGSVSGSATLAWSGVKDGDYGTVYVTPDTSNITLTLPSYAFSPSGSTLTISGGTGNTNHSVIEWKNVVVDGTNRISASVSNFYR